ncbi:efflux RND transporter periplasmic adaptor subunit [Cyclobacterium xiamenense]|uniref:efflux RND transporter periplasmic adaptor subunit n=1 Tax=Cyclobacterium xiamenense TaxID=1297121 RepID=UPI0035D09518
MKTTKNRFEKSPAFGCWVLAAGLALNACGSETPSESVTEMVENPSSSETIEITRTQFESSGMTLGTLEKVDFQEVVKAKGTIDVPPENRAELSSYFGGTVKEISLLPGERVKKGQVLFVLENPDYIQIQQDFLEAKAQLVYLESDYERQKNLLQDSISSEKKFLKAASDYEVTKARWASLGRKLVLMGIDPGTFSSENIRTTLPVRSPISGYVTEVVVSQGAYLTPSQLAVSIVNTDHIHLEMNVFEKDLAKISVGQPMRFRVQDDSDWEYEAAVYLINRTVDPENRTAGMHGHLLDETMAQKLRPGMYVEAEVYTSSEERWALPKDAVVDIEGRYYVLLLQQKTDTGYRFVKQEVKTGLSNTGYLEILSGSGLDESNEILFSGAFGLIKE